LRGETTREVEGENDPRGSFCAMTTTMMMRV
jgi:hypothetical protein